MSYYAFKRFIKGFLLLWGISISDVAIWTELIRATTLGAVVALTILAFLSIGWTILGAVLIVDWWNL